MSNMHKIHREYAADFEQQARQAADAGDHDAAALWERRAQEQRFKANATAPMGARDVVVIGVVVLMMLVLVVAAVGAL